MEFRLTLTAGVGQPHHALIMTDLRRRASVFSTVVLSMTFIQETVGFLLCLCLIYKIGREAYDYVQSQMLEAEARAYHQFTRLVADMIPRDRPDLLELALYLADPDSQTGPSDFVVDLIRRYPTDGLAAALAECLERNQELDRKYQSVVGFVESLGEDLARSSHNDPSHARAYSRLSSFLYSLQAHKENKS